MPRPDDHLDRARDGSLPSSKRGLFPGLLLWVVVCFVPALGGRLWEPGAWFAGLEKPSWNPPAAVFGPVWTLLYLLMAIAAWRIWRQAGFAGARPALTMFLCQLALNAAWTPVFFGLHEIGAALAVILALWLAIIATIVLFWRRDRWAAGLLLPYLAWVSFAAALNGAILGLNPNAS